MAESLLAASASRVTPGFSTVPDQSPSQIRDQVGRSEELLSDLHDRVTCLEQRFDTILTPVAP
ncbi:MAG: hypothetical protein ACREJC_23120, partial [Tepidisphaeraceae bacterium]